MPSPPAPEPLVLRPSLVRWAAWNLAFAAVLLFVLALLVVGGTWGLALLPLAPAVVPWLVSSSRMPPWRWTLVDAHGVTIHGGRTNGRIPWADIGGISFLPRGAGPPGYGLFVGTRGAMVPVPYRSLGLFARGRRMDALLKDLLARSGPHRAHIRTSAPGPWARAGTRVATCVLGVVLVGGAFLIVQVASPWTQPWWPGRDEASRLPGGCAVLDQAALARYVPGAPAAGDGPVGADASDDRTCAWGTDHGPPKLGVQLERSSRGIGAGGGASERAHHLFRLRADATCPSRTPGLGDEACTGVDGDGDQARARVVVRRGNVLVTVDYTAAEPAARASSDARRLAGLVLSSVTFE
ncbi:hypothetical protein [Actinomadura montaniterrae]|uniref:Uncharacterized protein n=1 Tax=Actinomadura montaniterrae TaxID=1803903 RepID=A0A6L3VKB7_9ACTN|nr:hypothetical protein [Actinomadura montaniterrae]KAB2365233.1 hypothetical protein F9B16_40895 [Actinomadura montaniterrae]